MQFAQARLKEALAGTNTTKEKGSQVADGILSLTPDTPDVIERRKNGRGVDCVETTSKYLEEGDNGPLPHELYGKFTWKIDNFSDISKRELRSNVFEVGSYKWYILVYPQGCDVCNHLSLFLCVADYDKLLPGWSHFAQFTIAVVNNDPKKSKYSDTLHRFCKKEHDWGWKKFMELSKVLDGFTVEDQLIIKAQVQVIRDTPLRPFRCLDPQYRRELVRVYLTNVENICRRFIEEKREQLWSAVDDSSQFVPTNQFHTFWKNLSEKQKQTLLREKASVILQRLVKRFFNEKEVTSTLVMDALYAGCKQLEEATVLKAEGKLPPNVPAPVVKIDAKRNIFYLEGDALQVWNRAATEAIPSLKDKPDSTGSRNDDSDANLPDTSEPDDRRLAELGRRTIEMFTIAHIFNSNLQSAFREEQSLRKQEELIREEEEAEREMDERSKKKAELEKEKRAKKKEKKKQKKEVERLKKQEEDDERAKIESEKRAEAERKQEEATQKRKLEEERMRERDRLLAAAKARSSNEKQNDKPKDKSKAASKQAWKEKESEEKPSSTSSALSESTDSGDDWQLGNGRGAHGSATAASASKHDDDDASSTGKRSWAAADRLTSTENIPGASSRTVTEALPSTSDTHRSVDDYLAQIAQLEARVAELEAQLSDKDSELVAMRSQLQELAFASKTLNPNQADAARAVFADSQSDASGSLMVSPNAALCKMGSGPAWSAASHASLGSTSDCSEAGTPSHLGGHLAPAASHDSRSSAYGNAVASMYRAGSAESGLPPPPPPSSLSHPDKHPALTRMGSAGPGQGVPHMRPGIPPSGPGRPGAPAAQQGKGAAAMAPQPGMRQQPVGAAGQQHMRATASASAMPSLASVKTGGAAPSGMIQGMMAPVMGGQAAMRTPRGGKPGKMAGAPPPPPGPPSAAQQYSGPRQSAWSSGAPPPPPPPPPQSQAGPGQSMSNGMRPNGSVPPPPPPGPSGSYRAAAAKIPGQTPADTRRSGSISQTGHDAMDSLSGHMGNGDATPRSIAPESPATAANHTNAGMEDFAHMGLITDLLE